MVKVVIGKQPLLVAVEWLVHPCLDFLLLECVIPNAKLIDLSVEILAGGVVGETDVDVQLPVEVGHVLDSFDHQFAVHVDELPAKIVADHVCNVVPLSVGQVKSIGYLDARTAPGADADVAPGQVQMPVMTASTKIGIHHAE